MLHVKEKAVGWSGRFKDFNCSSCEKQTSYQIVQKQDRLSIGPISIMGIGLRSLAKQCSNCKNLHELSKKEEKEAQKLRYYTKPQEKETSVRVATKREKKYPILTEERRKEIRANNRKEGTQSAVIGVFIGIIVIVINVWIGLGIIGFSILGGLYATFEDPEIKHRGIIDKYGYQKEI